MTALKAYTLGNNGFVRPAIIEALGEARHVRQAAVTIVATSKKAAVTLAETVGLRVSYSDSEFRQIDSRIAVDVLTFVEVTDNQPGVFASPRLSRPGDPIVELLPDGWRLVGRRQQDGIDWEEER